MPEIKLYYFNIRGLAEPIRMLMKYGGIEFEDVRIDREKWPEIKETFPYKQLPVLEIDGKQVGQSIAICRYLGNEVGLGGKTPLENLEIDSVVDTFSDLRQKVTAVAFGPDDKKAEGRQKLREEALPQFLTKLNTMAEENDGHLACKRLTWADIYFSALVGIFVFAFDGEGVLDNYPALGQVVDNVLELPIIKEWLDERPESDY